MASTALPPPEKRLVFVPKQRRQRSRRHSETWGHLRSTKTRRPAPFSTPILPEQLPENSQAICPSFPQTQVVTLQYLAVGDIGPLQPKNRQQKHGHFAFADLRGADGWRPLCNKHDGPPSLAGGESHGSRYSTTICCRGSLNLRQLVVTSEAVKLRLQHYVTQQGDDSCATYR